MQAIESVVLQFLAALLQRLGQLIPVQVPPTLSQHAGVVLTYNNQHPEFVADDVWSDPARGSMLHKITPQQAQIVATQLDIGCSQTGFDLAGMSACIAVESWFDPNAVDGNYEGSNPTKSLGGMDVGVCQFKLNDLVGSNGLTTVIEADAFASDPTTAIPYFFKYMQSKIAWAKQIIEQSPSVADPRFHDPIILATCAYNYGETGVLEEFYYKGLFPDGLDGRPDHGVSVINDWKYFAAKYGIAYTGP